MWLIACVVLASLSPVMLRAFGVELGPPLPVDPVAVARAGEPAVPQPIVDLAARSPVIASMQGPMRAPVAAGEPEILIFDDASRADLDDDASEPDADRDEVATGDPVASVIAEATGPDAITESTPRGASPRVATQPTELSEARAACRKGNKDAARSVYRDLPVGDARRKEIRRACRQEGVWIL